MANQPIVKNRDRNHSVSIFKDEYTTNNGEIRTRYSVAVQRSYKDKNGEWKQSVLNCFVEDLLPLSSLLENTYIQLNRYINNIRDKNQAPNQNTGCSDDDIPF